MSFIIQNMIFQSTLSVEMHLQSNIWYLKKYVSFQPKQIFVGKNTFLCLKISLSQDYTE